MVHLSKEFILWIRGRIDPLTRPAILSVYPRNNDFPLLMESDKHFTTDERAREREKRKNKTQRLQSVEKIGIGPPGRL